MLNAIELFAGIGAWKQALDNLGIQNKTFPVEIDKDTFWVHQKIHGRTFTDISSPVDIKKLSVEYLKADLIFLSPPCQNYSKAKPNNAKRKTDNLINYTLPIIDKTMPRYVVLENVPQFQKSEHYIDWATCMCELGYWQREIIINPIDYGFPQNRPRFFAIWCKYKSDFDFFKFPEKEKLILSVNSLISKLPSQFYTWKKIPENFKISKAGNSIYWGNYIDNRCFDPNYFVGTITATFNQPMICDFSKQWYRKLTPAESWVLMGFSYSQFQKIKKIFPKLSDSKLKKMAGNSIVVPIVEKILRNLNLGVQNAN